MAATVTAEATPATYQSPNLATSSNVEEISNNNTTTVPTAKETIIEDPSATNTPMIQQICYPLLSYQETYF